MGKSASQKMYVVDYRMSIHFGLGHTLDAIKEIRVNDKVAWSGRSTIQEIISINQPELFGGKQKEGGLVGSVLHLPGLADQVIPDWMAERFGLTSATMPGCRGYTSLFFYGIQQGYGTEGGGRGFLWSTNQPIVAQSISITGERAPPVLDPARRMIGEDANPAYMIYEALIDDDVGMGKDPATLDTQSYIDAGETLFAEEFGLSIFWAKQTLIETMVAEICDHIQATQFLSPQTGLWTLKLIRNDYDVSELPEINPSNAALSNFRRSAWGELANDIQVSYTDPENEESASVSAMDLSSIAAQGRVPGSRDYYGVRKRGLAMTLAERDVRTASTPLINLDAELDRRAWAIVPGQCFRVNWPKYGVENVIVRAMGVNTGKPGDSKIKLSLVQDVFSLSRGGINVAPDTGWVSPGEDPAPMDATEIITLPAYFTASGDLQTQSVTLVYPEVLAAVLGYKAGYDTTLFELLSYDYTSTGELTYVGQGSRSVTERAVLNAALPAQAESIFSGGIVARPERGPKIGGFVFLGVGEDESMEVAQVIGRDIEDNTWTIARGVLDTVPRAWPIGTPMWFVNAGLRIVDEESPRAVGEEVDYKLLSRTSRGVLSPASAPPVTETMNARPHMPLRPANVAINGTGYGPIVAGATAEFVITWATRNRQLEDGQVVRWTAPSVAPEYTQGTVVRVYDQTGVKVYEQPGLWTQEQHTLQKTWFDRYVSITVEIISNRQDLDLDSLQGHRIQITGFANNPAAPLPPGAIDTGLPPSPDAGPDVTYWSASGFIFDAASGAQTPAILISGKRDRPNAIGLTARYNKVGSTDLFVSKETALNDDPIQIPIMEIAATTNYHVEIAYRSDNNLLSQWTSLGDILTGVLISGSSQGLGHKTAEEVFGDIDDLNTSVDELFAIYGDTASAEASAAAAAAAASVATTAAANAEIAADAAADSLTAADAAADLAATRAGDAATSAAAAAGSASAASASQTAAGNSASAANVSKVAAEAARDAAAGSASAANTSANTAAASATTAGTAASTATTQAGIATTQAATATTQAGNAATSATSASGSASTATSQATLAATANNSATVTAANLMPSDFNALGKFWIFSPAGNPATAISRADAEFTGTPKVWVSPATFAELDARGVVVPIPGRTYRIEVQFKAAAANTTGNALTTANLTVTQLDATYAYLGDTGTAPSGYLNLWQGAAGVPTVLTTARVEWTAPSTPAAFIRPRLYFNYNGGSGSSGNQAVTVYYYKVSDITEIAASAGSASAAATSASAASASQTAAGLSATSATASANTASTQAGNATTSASSASSSAAAASSSAAAAQASAILSASVGYASLNRNPTFADYLTTPGIPGAWSDWDSGAIGTRQAGEVAGYAYDVDRTTTANQGIQQGGIYSAVGWYVIEADFWLQSATTQGAGVLFWGAAEATAKIDFSGDKDINETTGVRTPGVYRFRKLVQCVTAEAKTLYAITNWSGIGTATAKRIRWYRCSVRAASNAEIAGQRADVVSATNSATIITNAATAASATSAVATRATTLEALTRQGAPNLVKNSDFSNGLTSWTASGTAGTWTPYLHPTVGYIVNPPAVIGAARYQDVAVSAGQTYALSAEGDGGANGHAYVQWLDAPKTTQTGVSGNLTATAWNPRAVVVSTAPASTAWARVWIVTDTATAHNWGRFQFQQGSSATAWRSDGIMYDTVARVTVSEAAISTINGRVAAYWQVAVDAGSGSSYIRAAADGISGAVTMAADNIALYNRAGNALVPAFAVTGGNAYVNGILYVGALSKIAIDGVNNRIVIYD